MVIISWVFLALFVFYLIVRSAEPDDDRPDNSRLEMFEKLLAPQTEKTHYIESMGWVREHDRGDYHYWGHARFGTASTPNEAIDAMLRARLTASEIKSLGERKV